jgi:large subunit ribosomal protein L31
MKANIHPQYFTDTQVVCTACGNTFTSGSTKQQITVEVCYKCHPFFTGEQRFLDTKGRVETFQKKQEKAKTYQTTVKTKKKDKKSNDENAPKSLRELLGQI